MSKAAVEDLVTQYREAFRIIRDEVRRFDEQQWLRGISGYMVPFRIAQHTLDCLDYFFAEEPEYAWGHRFESGKPPSIATVLDYIGELEARIIPRLSALDDSDLSKPFPRHEDVTVLGQCVYALRHTMHHHGELAALNVYNGNEGGAWD